jgi:hypothetical protein
VWGLGPHRNGSPGHGDKLCRNWNGQRENYSYWLKFEIIGKWKFGKACQLKLKIEIDWNLRANGGGSRKKGDGCKH